MDTTDVNTQTEAQRRVDRIFAFRAELTQLDSDGVLTLNPDQQRAISTYHDHLLTDLAQTFDIDRSPSAYQLTLGMRVTSFLGAVALAASVFFLFYQFWGRFDTAVQVSILIGAALITFATTMLTARRDDSGYFVKLAALVAFACFVLNIVMVGSIFNITPSDNALIVWAAYAFLLAYAFDMRLLLVAAIICLVSFIAARAGTWGGMYWLSFGERPENFLPAGVALFALPFFVGHQRFTGFAATYRIAGLLAILLPVLLLANWGDGSYFNMEADVIEGGYQLLGFVLSAMVIAFGIRRRYPEVTNTGTVMFVIFLYTKFYDWWWEIMPKYLFFLVIGLTAILFLSVFKRLRGVLNRRAAA